jgi:trehalose synthase
LRARYLLRHPDKAQEMGRIAKELVRQNFLLTRNLQEYLSILVALIYGDQERIELQLKSAP